MGCAVVYWAVLSEHQVLGVLNAWSACRASAEARHPSYTTLQVHGPECRAPMLLHLPLSSISAHMSCCGMYFKHARSPFQSNAIQGSRLSQQGGPPLIDAQGVAMGIPVGKHHEDPAWRLFFNMEVVVAASARSCRSVSCSPLSNELEQRYEPKRCNSTWRMQSGQ